VSIFGSLPADEKVARLNRWLAGDVRHLVSKASMFGYGLNLQNCARQIFVGVNDSWEQFYQAVRRSWRFGQTRPVEIHIVAASTEGNVIENLQRKEKEANEMADEMAANTQDLTRMNLTSTTRTSSPYVRDVKQGEGWTCHLADCVELAREMEEESVHYSIFSPPFSSLYTYSNSERDMGNSRTDNEFWRHYKFLISESYRVMKTGRLVSIHCMNLPTSKSRDGYIGLRDFRGDIIRAYEDVGFIYHSEVCIWKDPVTAMQRTKALGLLHKQIKKDSAMSRQGIADYLVIMRKPGDNPEPVTNTNETFPVQLWQRFASPVWMDINPSDTLQKESAREHDDERHIAPLQLDVIRRGIKLWSNPGDLVWSPFTGIGSEGYVALESDRKFIGSELKRSYWVQACANLERVTKRSSKLF
jgi:DNA modification methylase